ncbi:NAD(P)H-quinone oxidoreductase [Rhodoplanes sp. TEM]|uniref:NAD(P)H-quinone oxidoreductase n=1 Tax=Rhodoplanes tepidamans TaxID=200616 RepID=A0ABT5JJD5_RHOTP|nr:MULTISPECIES: NAD(P)H-quinone oxidoreductase [Rhodoplanes]MDC7789717.1 NAD(P)H-quinone oxidoreductase [Rhodoplanes tepidamans]MDC7985866.1 NAD(P)H-quinone oxidoreductase [Rhodoplanes sp. TEM]MDQ0354394.1 NADPH2:quinone reductase [Rhodoplanes tepidamans]
MKRIEVLQAGGPEQMVLAEAPEPALRPGEVLVRVAAAGVNRPDVQQRRGLYPPPPEASPILGLDVAGVVARTADDVTWPPPGTPVCALVNGGGYAESCAVPAVQCMPIPNGFGFVEAASLPEVFFTAWNNVIMLGRLAEGESLLVQGGTSGVGLAAIQIATQLRGSTVYATAGSAEKCRVCLDYGAAAAIDYRTEDFCARLRELTQGRGVDVVLDGQAGPYTDKELGLLAPDGRVVLIASHLGAMAEVNVRDIVRRRLTLTGSTLRPRPPAYKGRIARALVEEVWPLLADGRIRTRIHATVPLAEVAAAHGMLEAGEQIGKVVLIVDPALVTAGPG